MVPGFLRWCTPTVRPVVINSFQNQQGNENIFFSKWKAKRGGRGEVLSGDAILVDPSPNLLIGELLDNLGGTTHGHVGALKNEWGVV